MDAKSRSRRARWTGRRRLAVQLALAGLLCGLPGARGASAESWEWGELRASVDSFFSVSTSIRAQDRDCRFVATANGGCSGKVGPIPELDATEGALVNGDDGNLNWNDGDVFSVLTKGSHDIQLDWRNYGAFLRFNYFFDPMLNDESNTRRTDLRSEARQRDAVFEGGVVGRQFLLLDAYLYADFDVADRYFDVRVGNQVLSWGESIFIQGGINAINSIDVSKIRLPGSELKEALAPAPIARVSGDLVGSLSFEAYYQFGWRRTQLDPVGTFFSTSDLVGRGTDGFFTGCGDRGTNPQNVDPFLCGFVLQKTEYPFRGNEPASDQGQWGAALRYYIDALETELGVYYIRLHDKYPTVSFKGTTLDDLGYINEYPEQIDLYGFSFNTLVAGIAVGGEVSYRQNQPTPITGDPGRSLPGFQQLLADVAAGGPGGKVEGSVREDRIVAILNGLYQVGPGTVGVGQLLRAIGASEAIAILEFGVTHYLNFRVPKEFYPTPQGVAAVDDTGLGYQLRLELTYDRILGTPLTFKPILSFRHDLYGITPPGEAAYNQHTKQVGVTLELRYQERFVVTASYSNSFGGGVRNGNRDRDFAGFSISYAY
ncbi:MAG: DUF1302 domain-containing protein [Myxococcota bacterium]